MVTTSKLDPLSLLSTTACTKIFVTYIIKSMDLMQAIFT